MRRAKTLLICSTVLALLVVSAASAEDRDKGTREDREKSTYRHEKVHDHGFQGKSGNAITGSLAVTENGVTHSLVANPNSDVTAREQDKLEKLFKANSIINITLYALVEYEDSENNGYDKDDPVVSKFSGEINEKDRTNPIISSSLEIINSSLDASYELGNSDFTLNWTVNDSSDSGTYVLFRERVEIMNGTWLSNSTISTSLADLNVGIYNFTILVTDSNNNFANDTVYIIISDTTEPILSSPEDASFEFGNSNFTLNWTITDLSSSGTYILFRDGEKVMNGTWPSNSTISTNLASLSVGNYNFTIVVMDSSNNSVKSTVLIIVRPNNTDTSTTTVNISTTVSRTTIFIDQNFPTWPVFIVMFVVMLLMMSLLFLVFFLLFRFMLRKGSKN